MSRVLRGLLLGGVIGVVLGVLSRGLMRVIALGMELETEFHAGVSLVIVSLFVLSGAGAGLAGSLRLGGWVATPLVLVTSSLLLLLGTAIGAGEVAAVLDADLPPARTTGLLAAAGLIVLCLLATPGAAWWVGRRRAMQDVMRPGSSGDQLA